MAYEFNANANILKYARPGSYIVISGTLANTGVVADSDGRKIVPAGTVLESASTGTIRANGDKAKVCGLGNKADAEALLYNTVDVTAGDAPAQFLILGKVDASVIPNVPSNSTPILEAFGIDFVGAVTENPPPVLTFSCVADDIAGDTKVESVTPTLTEGSSYFVGVNVDMPKVGDDLTANADFTAYTLGDAITAEDEDDIITIVECSTGDIVTKAGTDTSVPGVLPPELTFVCVDHADAGKTKISSVDPVAGGTNTYMVYVGDVGIPSVGVDLTGVSGWTAYTLDAGITATDGDNITLVEVSTGDVVVKAGASTAVVA